MRQSSGQSRLQQGIVVDMNEQSVDLFRQLETLPELVVH